MVGVLVKFLVVFIPTLAITLGGFWLALNRTGLLSALGWVVAVPIGLMAALQAWILINGLLRILRWSSAAEQRLMEMEKRDAELLAQGKSFDEVMSQYKKPRP